MTFNGARAWLVAAMVTALVSAGIVVGAPIQVASAAAADTTYSQRGTGYVPLTPARLLDTRIGLGATKARLVAGGSVTVQVTGRGGVPASGVAAVAVNATAVAASKAGYATVFPAGVARPVASTLNYTAGSTVANQVLAKLGSGGRLTLYSHASSDLLLDVSGYYPTAAVFTPLTPTRLLDTRSGFGAARARVGAGKTLDLRVVGRGGVPASGAGTVVLNVTAVTSSGAGYVTVFPTGQPRPTASNLNYLARQTVPALVMAKVGTGGKVSIYTHSETDLLADVLAYIPDGSDYSALPTPSRLVDTRLGLGASKARVPARGSVTIQVAGAGGLPDANVAAAFLNVTAVNPAGAGYLSVYPAGTARPTTSVVNYTSGSTRANSVLARLGTAGQVTIYSHAATDLVVDVAGNTATPLSVTMTQPTTTKIVPASTTMAVTAPTTAGGAGSVTTTASVPAPGGYIYLPPGGSNGDGVLGKVTSSTTSGGATTAAIVGVPLEEAFPAGHIEGTTAASDPLVSSLTSQQAPSRSSKSQAALTPTCTGGATVGVKVDAKVELRVAVLADWGPGKRTHLRVTNTAGVTLEGSVELASKSTCTWSSLPVPLGPIGPFVASGTWDVKVEVSGAIKAGVAWTASTTNGFDWWSGQAPTRINSHAKQVTWTPPGAATATVKFSVGPTAHLKLAGVAGPEVSSAAFVEVKADTAANPWWTVSFGIENEAKLTIDVMFLLHAEFTVTRSVVFSVQLGRATGGYPGYVPLAITTTTLPSGTVGASYTATLAAAGGTAPYTWTATGLPAGLSLSAGTGKIAGTPTTSGLASVRATVTDSDGRRLSATLTLPVTGGAGGTGTVKQISAGLWTACSVLTSGAATCWGYNGIGDLGNGTTMNSSVPVQVTGLGSGVASISAGASHSCAVLTSGAATCWGGNGLGELGNGTTTSSNVPVPVTGLGSGVVSISSGGFHTCAVLTSGAATCWGYNGNGELGNGTTTSSSVPVQVTGLGSGVASISTGASHTCAVLTSGAATCWGYNGNGELGNGTTTDSSVQVPVTGLGSGVAQISSGWAHVCAVLTSGAATCWGWNGHGELGNGTTTNSPVRVPVPVTGLGSGVASIDVGRGHSCAVRTSGAALCWGDNVYGGLGDGTTMRSSVPAPVTGLNSGVASIDVGSEHTCAVRTSGAATCWGYNVYGGLGDGTTTDSSVPVPVTGLG